MSMKITKLVLVIGAMAMAGGAMAAGSDSMGTAAVNATVLAPIVITKNVDLNFGTFAPDKETAGTVVIAATNGARSVSGGVFVPSTATAAAGAAASFGIAGDAGATFSIALPTSDITLTNLTGAGGETMSVAATSLTAAVGGASVAITSGAGTSALISGAATLTVGGTLTVGLNQVPGVYTNAAGLPVTVAYN
ncbi:DUF4402 domain-containing protein [Rhodoferax sp. PAMC 29310]|uniref:DUF4402 domain-containing protein n=1 Tax=Rhodoferax sp. PAMC 29310 TaxID=2822760 RepID=UPI001B319E09|nr:DUF4402 domain-containing protein [Rhodoferax sp. PAMC 29310]